MLLAAVQSVSGNAAKSGIKTGDTIIYASSFFGDELWPTDKLSFTQTAIQRAPSPICFVYVSATCRLLCSAVPESSTQSSAFCVHSYVAVAAGSAKQAGVLYSCSCGSRRTVHTCMHLYLHTCMTIVQPCIQGYTTVHGLHNSDVLPHWLHAGAW